MTQGTHQLAATMINQLNRVDVISNNLANLNTTGFKADSLSEGSFNSYLERATEKKENISKVSYIMNTVPKIDNNYINSKIGSLSITGNKFDFALSQSNTYFKIQMPNGDIQLTRDGKFKTLDNILVTQNGNKVLDHENKPINSSDSLFVSKISLVSENFVDLKKVGNNNYLSNNKNTKKIDNNLDYLVQGSIEKSNTNSVQSMISMIDAQRRFEQAQKAITSIDEINKKVIADVGSVR